MSYQQVQQQRDQQYQREWRAWERSLGKSDRAALRRAGISGPLAGTRTSKWGPDIGSVTIGVIEDAVEEEAGAEREAEYLSREDVLGALRLIMSGLLAAKNAQLEVRCLALAIGFPLPDLRSGAEVARKYGVTRAAVSLKVKNYQEMFAVRSAYNKAAGARERYRQSNRRRKTV